jgi:hypothetical protein
MTMMLTFAVAVLQALAPVAATTPHTPAAGEADAPVQVAIETNADPGGGLIYRVVLTNATATPVLTTVVQWMPPDATAVTAEGAKVDGDRITWSAKVAANADVTLRSTVALPVPHAAVAMSACATDAVSGRLLDCASSTIAPVAESAPPWWQSWLPIAVLVLALGILTWIFVRAVRHRRAQLDLEPPARKPRRDLPSWVPVGLAVIGLLAATAMGLAALGPRLRAAATINHGLAGHGWSGPRVQAAIGTPVSDGIAEFTVYSATCTTAKVTTCDVAAGIRTVGDQPLLIYRSMQRMYTSDTTWVEPDPVATTKANGGTDVFAGTLEPGSERLIALRFTLPAGARPQWLELHEGAFARGAYLDL